MVCRANAAEKEILMKKLFRKGQVFTIPNLLSFIRLLLIPLILWLYMGKKQYIAAVVVIVLSGITDMLDGTIARKFHMVSDLGKALDPTADKLTQAAMLLCVVSRYRVLIWLIILFACKELIMAVLAYLTLRRGIVNGASWHGKVNTFVLYAVMIILILFPDLPKTTSYLLVALCACTMIISLVLYTRYYLSVLRQPAPENASDPGSDDDA